MRRAITLVASAVVICAALVASRPFGLAAGPTRPAYRAPQCRAIVPIKAGRTGAPNTPAASLSHYDSRVQASFVTRFDAERRGHLTVKSQDLQVEKAVAPDGSFTLILQAGDDRVVASLQKAGLDVSRNGSARHLEFGQAADDEFLAVQSLLAGSKAVRMHHIVAANLEERTLTTPGGAATLLSDVFLGLLGGDVAAIDRFGRELARRRQRSSPAIVRARWGREDGPDSCYVRWENEVMAAWYQYVACKVDYLPFNPLQEICNLRYYMRTECAWFELLSCCAIPIRVE
ncbi:MAG: hypothetical protein ACM3NQ_02540 [Bacteroidales bacterium]